LLVIILFKLFNSQFRHLVHEVKKDTFTFVQVMGRAVNPVGMILSSLFLH
jgi:hypothetical protein